MSAAVALLGRVVLRRDHGLLTVVAGLAAGYVAAARAWPWWLFFWALCAAWVLSAVVEGFYARATLRERYEDAAAAYLDAKVLRHVRRAK